MYLKGELMAQIAIEGRPNIVDKKGRMAAKGYSTTMNIVYNRDDVRKNAFNLKEWNFYQFKCGEYVLQMTMGHVSYMSSVSLALFRLSDGKKWEIGSMKPFGKLNLDLDPQGESYNQYVAKDFAMSFEITRTQRILHFCGKNKQYSNVEVHLVADNDPTNPKMVIATPFAKAHQFYLNYKENYYNASGFVAFDDMRVDFDNATGLLDWGRGIWPYKHEWFWGNMTDHIDGVPFGLNIGWGFGDLSCASENMFFYDKKAHKVGHLHVERDENNYMAPWKLWDDEGTICLNFAPIYDNYTQNKFVVVDTHCNQVFGTFTGYVLVDGNKIEIPALTAFIEHAVNRW